MTDKEAMKLALDALNSMKETLAEHEEPTTFNEDEAITAIKERLAQPTEQEPVAWIEHHKGGDNLEWDNPGGKCTPLYTTPPAQPADPTGQAPCAKHCEATAFQIVIKNLRGEIERLKAPQRKPLTDE